MTDRTEPDQVTLSVKELAERWGWKASKVGYWSLTGKLGAIDVSTKPGLSRRSRYRIPLSVVLEMEAAGILTTAAKPPDQEDQDAPAEREEPRPVEKPAKPVKVARVKPEPKHEEQITVPCSASSIPLTKCPIYLFSCLRR